MKEKIVIEQECCECGKIFKIVDNDTRTLVPVDAEVIYPDHCKDCEEKDRRVHDFESYGEKGAKN